MNEDSRARFAEAARSEPADVGRACLLMGCEVEPDLDVEACLAGLDTLAERARVLVSEHGSLTGLQMALAGFEGGPEDFDDLRSSLLHQVLRRRRGLPVLLSVLWCEVADRLDLVALPLALPGHVMVCLGDPLDEHVVVDPFHGGEVVPVIAEPVLMPVDLLLRVLTNIRALAARQSRSLDATRTQLWASELSLLLPRHPMALRRERGELLVRLGSFAAGARDLEEFAALVQDVDPSAAVETRQHAQRARAQLN